jgi:hypothetical protein
MVLRFQVLGVVLMKHQCTIRMVVDALRFTFLVLCAGYELIDA